MSHPAIARQRHQSGQAMTELLVACLVLVPLWLAVWLIGPYSGLQQAAVQASRFAAFERASRPGDTPAAAEHLANQLRARFFLRGDGLPGNPRGEIRSGDGAGADAFGPSAQVAWWRGPGGLSLLPDARQVTLVLEARATLPTVQAADGFMHATFGLPAQQVHVAHVEVPLANLLQPEGPRWHVGASTAVSADSANLRGSQGVREALAHAAPVASGLRALSALQAVVAVPMAWLEDTPPAMPCVRVEALPRDRVAGEAYRPGACQ